MIVQRPTILPLELELELVLEFQWSLRSQLYLSCFTWKGGRKYSEVPQVSVHNWSNHTIVFFYARCIYLSNEWVLYNCQLKPLSHQARSAAMRSTLCAADRALSAAKCLARAYGVNVALFCLLCVSSSVSRTSRWHKQFGDTVMLILLPALPRLI